MKRTNTTPRKKVWTVQAVRALGVRTDIRTAASVLGISDRTAYALVSEGTFPVPALKLGNKYVIPVEPLCAWLGITDETEPVSIQRPALSMVPNSPEVA